MSKKLEIKSVSSCCKKDVIIQGGTTMFHRCSKCLAPCDVVTYKTIRTGKETKILTTLTTEEFELLEKYSLFLEKNGYMDVDWRAEEPTAIDRFTDYLRKSGKKINKKPGKRL